MRRLTSSSGSAESSSGRKKPTPIYRRDPTKGRVKREFKRQPDDILVDLMMDGRFHGVCEIVDGLPLGTFTLALEACLDRGYAFDRDGNRMRLRRRAATEKRQLLFDILDGLTTDDFAKPVVAKKVIPSPVVDESAKGVVKDVGKIAESATVRKSAGPELSLSAGDDPLKCSAAESVTMTSAILAKKSSGKTYLGMVIVEEILRSGIAAPVVVVDPMGVWAPGLRCMADGTPSPYQFLTLGGPHGDLPLRNDQGAQAAEVVERLRPHPVILDLSDMVPAEQHEVVADFGERLFATRHRSPLLLVVDEADEFAPQVLSASAHQKRSLEILDRIVRRGRIKGLGTVLISQRAAVVNKNVLSQIDRLFLLCMLAPSDLDAVESWLHHVVPVKQRSSCLGQLPTLPPGNAFYMRGGAEPAFRKFVVRRRDTYDSSCTPEGSERAKEISLSMVSAEVLEVARKIMGASLVEAES